jgi:glycosyltransferase involved in cell wall biosynthesis
MEGVSFVVPVHNGVASIRETLAAVAAQADGRPIEVIVVDDRSRDGSSEILHEIAKAMPLRIVEGEGRGAAAAINTGVRVARFPIICQVDQDVFLRPGWMSQLVGALDDPAVAAVQGYYETDPSATLCARAMSLDLEQRYAAIEGSETDHVCTGNSAYRATAIHQVGLFDETFGYGYDNDISYRLRDAGYRLAFCRDARSLHRWREGFSGYLVQQYGFGYGRIDVVAKHPARFSGDAVSPAAMMSHPILMSLGVAGLMGALLAAAAGGPWQVIARSSSAVLAVLAVERLSAGIAAARRFNDAAALAFPLIHLARDLAWVAALATWSGRRLVGRPGTPWHSMRARTPLRADRASLPAAPFGAAVSVSTRDVTRRARRLRILCVIPAHNEATNLSAVVAEVRACRPDLDIVVVDDGSTDDTATLLDRLGVRWLRFSARMGIGSAMRAGLRYASRLGYDAVVRMDGDGQHRAQDIDALLGPIHDGAADVSLGSRYASPRTERPGFARPAHRLLAACLSALTRRRVTDPTSGFCAIGSRAIRLLAEHHPTGYAEPELRLFLSRNALSVVEVPVRGRSRLGGKTSLTAGRVTAAGARVMLAMIIVPFRGRVGEPAGD